MSEITILPVAEEPEERIERALCAILSSSCTIRIDGALAPVDVGDVKHFDEDTFVSVLVDQSSQDGDYRGNAPYTYSATITVRVAAADDPNGLLFREECRRVRAALYSLTGDGCKNLNADGFRCDALILDSTSTSFGGEENPLTTKAYSVTLKGRTINTTEAK